MTSIYARDSNPRYYLYTARQNANSICKPRTQHVYVNNIDYFNGCSRKPRRFGSNITIISCTNWVPMDAPRGRGRDDNAAAKVLLFIVALVGAVVGGLMLGKAIAKIHQTNEELDKVAAVRRDHLYVGKDANAQQRALANIVNAEERLLKRVRGSGIGSIVLLSACVAGAGLVMAGVLLSAQALLVAGVALAVIALTGMAIKYGIERGGRLYRNDCEIIRDNIDAYLTPVASAPPLQETPDRETYSPEQEGSW